MTKPKKRKMSAAEHIIQLAKSRRRMRNQRTQRALRDINASLEKSSGQLHGILQQQHQLHLAFVEALDKRTRQAEEVPEAMKTAVNTFNDGKKDVTMNLPHDPISFSKLPLEIRTMIWEMALPDRRVFEPRLIEVTETGNYTLVYLQQGYPPPVIRGVCKEAWEVTETHGRFCFGLTGNAHFGYWFNPSKDLVLLSNSLDSDEVCDEVCDITDYLESYLRVIAFSGAQHMAWCSWYLHNHSQVIRDVFLELPEIETITAVVEAVTMEQGTNVKAMYPLKNDDAMTMCRRTTTSPEKPLVSWALEREFILAEWEAMANKTWGDKVPQLNGLEVVRTKQVPGWLVNEFH